MKFLVFLMDLFCRQFDLGEVLFAPFLIRLRALRRGREPDILSVAREHLDRLQDTYLDGPPDLVVEVVSPESEQRDRVTKFAEYAAAGIPEYWLVDAGTRRPEFYRLGPGGSYQRVEPDEHGIYRSVALPGFWLRIDWLQRDPLPTRAALEELSLVR